MIHRLLSIFAPSLRSRLTLLIGAILLPPAILTSWLIVQVYWTERRGTERHLMDAAEAFSALIDAQLRERIALLQSLESASALIAGDLGAFRERAIRVVDRRGEWVVLADANHRQLLNTSLPPGAPLPEMEHLPELKRAGAGDDVYISNLVRSATNRLIVHVATQVQFGGRSGVLSLAIEPQEFARLLLRRQRSQGWLVAVIDREKTVIARNRLPEKFIGLKATPDMQAAIDAADSGLREAVTLDGERSLVAHARSAQSGWAVIVGAPKEELFAPAKRLFWLALLAAAVVAAFAVSAAWWLRRTTLNVVQLLVADTEALAHGQKVGSRRTGIHEADIVSAALADTSNELAARQAALARARDEALAASRAKDEFLASLSHELRTPLNPVLLLASEAARDASLPADVRELFATIEKNVVQETRLIDDLLDVTRIAAGKVSLVLQPVELESLVAEAVEAVKPAAAKKQLEVRLRRGAAQATVQADPVRLLQVLTNVLSNAVKFTPENGIVLVTTRLEPEEKMVAVKIADSGIGMNAEELARIFQRFAQGDHAKQGRGSRFGGLGLGLSISRSLVEMHGGRIEATSAGSGRGSVFTVTLPLRGESVWSSVNRG